MSTVTIANEAYTLGDLSFSDENIVLFEQLSNMGDTSKSLPLRGMRRVLHESLVNGNGEEKADKAMSSLRIDFSEGSDLRLAFEALGRRLRGSD